MSNGENESHVSPTCNTVDKCPVEQHKDNRIIICMYRHAVFRQFSYAVFSCDGFLFFSVIGC